MARSSECTEQYAQKVFDRDPHCQRRLVSPSIPSVRVLLSRFFSHQPRQISLLGAVVRDEELYYHEDLQHACRGTVVALIVPEYDVRGVRCAKTALTQSDYWRDW